MQQQQKTEEREHETIQRVCVVELQNLVPSTDVFN